ncbi:hypothetical protein, partial [Erwinia amylovora]|uniref:hypothetical protein n=1 Tax=Erwinia amylovora TaxID=552 RepID=UPI003D6F5270
RITEILRRRDVEKLMECVQLLMRQGGAVFLFDLDESFMYRYCDRIDVVREEVLRAEGLTFPGMAPLDLQIHSGEIALLRDENYTASLRLRECFLGGQSW